MKKRLFYLICFILLFCAELYIAVKVHDQIVRPYVGDMLVVILIYVFLRIWIPEGPPLLCWYIFLFAAGVEALQYFRLADLLGLQKGGVLRIVLGSTFDWKDILCYLAGTAAVQLIELGARAR